MPNSINTKTTKNSKTANSIWHCLLCLLLLICFLEIAVAYRAFSDLREVKSYCAAGTRQYECLNGLVRAARWSSPFSNLTLNVGASALNLLLSAKDLDVQQKTELLWKLRRSVYASRSFLRPEHENKSELLQRIDQELKLAPDLKSRIDPGSEPNHFFQICAQIFFFAWIIGVIFVIWRGFDAQLRPQKQYLVRWLPVVSLTFVSWLATLLYA